MKIQFKVQDYQTAAVDAVVEAFSGQPRISSPRYMVDPGRLPAAAPDKSGNIPRELIDVQDLPGFRNADLQLSAAQILQNIQQLQRRQNLPQSRQLVRSPACGLNLDVEMETGTGKTYCYIKTMFQLHEHYGWNKFIVVVPSVAIREGVYKSFQITADHFLQQYGRRARCFIYDSKQLHELESFSSDAGVNVMIINAQAFNAFDAKANNKNARIIFSERDDFQSRRPIDVLKKNRPILILDEPQRMGAKTAKALAEFDPLMILRYSATHRTEHNKVYRLDALDAYNQKLVKKIAVRGIAVKGLPGTNAYLYLEAIRIAKGKPPVAIVEMEQKQTSGVKRVRRIIGRNDNLFELSGELDQYKGFVVSEIDARDNSLEFTGGVRLICGTATGNVGEDTLRRIQIREAIKAHFEKEQQLHHRGVKVLTLFFIDSVANYRQYDDDGNQIDGKYAEYFEQEYASLLEEYKTLFDDAYEQYIRRIAPAETHKGYFSIDKKTKRLVDPAVKSTGETKGETDDVSAYDLILKDKERLLSLDEPTRFIFSHSALREGWDNPNVFVIGMLKPTDYEGSNVTRRQEVGRGLRLCVDQDGRRIDDASIVHEVNVLTVVANESFHDFVANLQGEIRASLSDRPRTADEDYFAGKLLRTEQGDQIVDATMARKIHRYLVKNDYVDDANRITDTYHQAKAQGALTPLPDELQAYAEPIFGLIDSVFDDSKLPTPEDDRRTKKNELNRRNFEKQEFQDLWRRINRKAVYTVDFETDELVRKCVAALDAELRVTTLRYVVQAGEQKEQATLEDLERRKAFQVYEHETNTLNAPIASRVKYDLVGKLSGATQLTRRTIVAILSGIDSATFQQFGRNPEEFILDASRIINEQKATVVIEHLVYDPLDDRHDSDIFTVGKNQQDFAKAFEADRHIYDYVFTDSETERSFVEALDTAAEVVVYAKLPKAFAIPTPVGDYNPDWAIAFEHRKVKHIFFVAETKGSMSTLQLRKIEQAKIDCARKFFARITSDQVRYEAIDSYAQLMALVK